MLISMNFLSSDGKSFSFDARARGYARGEGVILMVLKPLKAALADGDMIRAVVRATSQNQDGRTLILTQPSADAQEMLIRHVDAKARLGLEETRSSEAHADTEAAVCVRSLIICVPSCCLGAGHRRSAEPEPDPRSGPPPEGPGHRRDIDDFDLEDQSGPSPKCETTESGSE